MTPSIETTAGRFVLAAVFLLGSVHLGCGRDSRKGDDPASGAPLVDPAPPPLDYPTLPEEAPLRDRLDEAASSIERDLLQEQEKFYLRREADIRAIYTDEEGTPLVPPLGLEGMVALMRLQPPFRVRIECARFELLVPAGTRVSGESAVQSGVRMLGGKVPASARLAPEVQSPTIVLGAIYRYEPTGPGGDPVGPGATAVQRELVYVKPGEAAWRRVRVDEAAVPRAIGPPRGGPLTAPQIPPSGPPQEGLPPR